MNTFLQRNTLLGSAAVLGLLSALLVPAAQAEEAHGEHDHSAAQPTAKEATNQPSAPAQGHDAASPPMGHGNMNHDAMMSDDTNHEQMMHAHDDAHAEAGSDHGQ